MRTHRDPPRPAALGRTHPGRDARRGVRHRPGACESVGEKFKVPSYTDMHEMARASGADVFSVLTPSGYHAEHVIALAQHGKHVVVEKPMALTLDDPDQIIRVCDRNSVKLFVVKQNRFNVPVVKLREGVEKGRFGESSSARCACGGVERRRTTTRIRGVARGRSTAACCRTRRAIMSTCSSG